MNSHLHLDQFFVYKTSSSVLNEITQNIFTKLLLPNCCDHFQDSHITDKH